MLYQVNIFFVIIFHILFESVFCSCDLDGKIVIYDKENFFFVDIELNLRIQDHPKFTRFFVNKILTVGNEEISDERYSCQNEHIFLYLNKDYLKNLKKDKKMELFVEVEFQRESLYNVDKLTATREFILNFTQKAKSKSPIKIPVGKDGNVVNFYPIGKHKYMPNKNSLIFHVVNSKGFLKGKFGFGVKYYYETEEDCYFFSLNETEEDIKNDVTFLGETEEYLLVYYFDGTVFHSDFVLLIKECKLALQYQHELKNETTMKLLSELNKS